MKINRKPITNLENFGELLIPTTFILPSNKTAIFMTVDMSTADICCDRCDNDIVFNNDYAVNLSTGEVEYFDYHTKVIPINCEVNEI